MKKRILLWITAILVVLSFALTGCGGAAKTKMSEGTAQTLSGIEKDEADRKESAATGKPERETGLSQPESSREVGGSSGTKSSQEAEGFQETKEAAADKETKSTEASQPASREEREQKASEASKTTEKASGSAKNSQDTQTASKPAAEVSKPAGKPGSGTGSTASKQPSGETKKPSGDSAGSSKEESKVPEPAHTCTWDGGSTTREPDCSNAGEKTYTCTVCGKTKTESIGKTDHSYVTENTAPTCTEAGHTKTYCSICGAVQSDTESGSPAGHSFVKEYWPSEPTCQHGADWVMKCAVCGETGDSGWEDGLEHTPVTEIVEVGNCSIPTRTVTTCSQCGLELGRDGYYEDDHDWVETEDQVFNEETLEWETVYYSYCSRCHAQQH